MWAKFWFGLEDPRAIALFRIVFVFFTICNVNGVLEYAGFLFSDEGILPAELARQTMARAQFAGYGHAPGEPAGFFDLEAFAQFVTGPKFSLLFFWDSPTAVWVHVAAFEVAALCLLVGFKTRASAVACFVLMTSLFDRNRLFWEGTDVVIRVFFVYLLFARSGHAWSVDNWRRCRRLSRAGRLRGSDPADRAEPIYRRIPAWPRRLMMLQLAVLYFTTGAVKSGAVWANGDAIYYAMNLDHFYRLPTQQVSSWFGLNVLRVLTWGVRYGEILFPLAFVGAVLRVADEETTMLARRPRTASVFRWLRTWVFGRRVWITWAAAAMGGILLVVNIGQFQTVMLTLCLVYFRGEELERGLARLRKRPPVPAKDPSRRDGTQLPTWAIATASGVFCAALAVELRGGPGTHVAWAAVAFLAGVFTYRAFRVRATVGVEGLAYGRFGRTVLGLGLTWHAVAVGLWLTPKADATEGFRKPARAWAKPWLTATRTVQSWNMFAPNPPRRNVFMQVLVTDTDDNVWDMRSDVYDESRRALPFLAYDRMRKMNRRMIGGESGGGSWYRKWYARWQCRDYALKHGGVVPYSVELIQLSYLIPSPEAVAAKGWYRPEERLHTHGRSKRMETVLCQRTVESQPPPHVAARHGVVSTETYRPRIKRRYDKWQSRGE
ncbi:MAG: HTTM domain-containing protein [Myxococcota bacterium]